MKRWVAMLLILVFTLSGCGLLEGIGETDPAANPVEGNTGTDADYLSLTAELEQARKVKLELGSEAQAALPDFAAAVEVLRDQGLEFLSYGMPRQASWYLSFAGGSVSAVRYAAELLLGESSTGFSGWDTIGAISLCSPVPFLCEAVTAEKSGDTDRAAQCRELAARNPYTANGFDDFSALASLSDSGLRELVEGLKSFEEHIYWFYPADPQSAERSGMEWSADYHLGLAALCTEMGLTTQATDCCMDALAADPFDPEVFSSCAVAMYSISDLELMQVYIEEGLLIDPEHGGLNALGAMLYAAAGQRELAQEHLNIARTGELTETEQSICDAVDAFLKGE